MEGQHGAREKKAEGWTYSERELEGRSGQARAKEQQDYY